MYEYEYLMRRPSIFSPTPTPRARACMMYLSLTFKFAILRHTYGYANRIPKGLISIDLGKM